MKKILVLALIVVLSLTLFSACGSADKSFTDDASPAATEDTGSTEPEKIVVAYTGTPAQDQEMVNEAIAEMVKEKANVDPEIMVIEAANYPQQINLMLASNEQLDVFLTYVSAAINFSTMTANNQLMDITDLAPVYAQDALEAINSVNPGYLAGTTVNGKLYALTCLYDKVSSVFISFRKDVMEKNNLDLSSVKNMDDLENILATLKENETVSPWAGNFVGMVTLINPDDFSNNIQFDSLGDSRNRYGVVIGEDSTEVVNLYATDWYKEMVTMMRDWYNKGYIYKDAATTTENGYGLVGSNAVLGMINNGESEFPLNVDSRAKYEMVNANLGEAMVSTSVMKKFTWAIASTSKNPEAGLKFLNLLYTDADLLNLINYGIKDVHYVDGSDSNLIALPEGMTVSNVPYSTLGTFMFGNQFLTKVWEPGPNDLRETALEINKNAKVSNLMGFLVDNTNITEEFTAITAVTEQYRKALEFGVVDPEEVLPEFLDALDAAGMQTVLDEVQKQVDEFLAEKN